MEDKMSKKKKKQVPPQGFQIPQSFLTQMGEFTSSYILFSYNEFGIPQVYTHCDSPMAANALQNHIKTWIGALEAINTQITAQQIISS